MTTKPTPVRTPTPSTLPTPVLNFATDTSFDDLPDDVVIMAKRCLLDLLGVAAAGRTTSMSNLMHDHAATHFGAGIRDDAILGAPMIFDGREVSPAGAALAGACTIDSIDAHDGNKITKGHTGCHQLPALLAFCAAEKLDDPREFLALLVVGYELATRAGIAMHATAADYHSSGSWGAVGAAAVGARVLGLDHQTMFEAMGIAEYHGPRSQMMRVVDHPTMVKDGSAWGAMAGVSAAYLAASGFTGAPAILTNDPSLDWLWADLGTRWIIHEQYFKPQPVCRWAQPAVEAALELCRAHDFASGDVVGIEVATFHEASRLGTALPTTTEQAQYSLAFPVAAAIANGRVGPSEVASAALSDPEIVRLVGLVSLVEDDAHNEAFPANRFARVTLSLRDGQRLESADTEPRGDPEDHLDDAEIRAKFYAYAGPILGQSRSAAIEAAVDGLDTAESLSSFLGLVTGPIDPS